MLPVGFVIGVGIIPAYLCVKQYFDARRQQTLANNPLIGQYVPQSSSRINIDWSGSYQSSPRGRLRTEQEIRQARQKLNMESENTTNIAVCGNSGTGKSTFINCIRGLPDIEMKAPFIHQQDGSAPVGIMETTKNVASYQWPRNAMPHVTLWDMPAVGASSSRDQNYFEEQELYAFDCLLLLRAGRFTQFDVAICQQARQYQIPIVLVISKGDQDVENNKKIKVRQLRRRLTDDEDNALVSKTKATLKENAIAELNSIRTSDASNVHDTPPIFVIAAQHYRDALNGTLQPGDVSPLETEELINHFLVAAIDYRKKTNAD